MTRLLEILISLAIVLGLYLVIALVLPSKRHLVEKIETNRKLSPDSEGMTAQHLICQYFRQLVAKCRCDLRPDIFQLQAVIRCALKGLVDNGIRTNRCPE